LLLCALLAGCAVGPDYRRPELELPTAWRAPEGTKTAQAGTRWWRLYQDPLLERLVEEALAHNADLQVAAARVLEARALAGIVDADRYPVVAASFAAARTRSSTVGSFPLPAGVPATQRSYSATLDAAYEIDLWGKYRRASEAARAELLAAEWAREAVRLSLTAQVARQYFALIAAEQQEATLRRVAAGREESAALLRRRFEGGLASEFDLRTAEAEAAAARSQLATAVQARERQDAALALLLGRSPRAVLEEKVDTGTPAAQTAPWVPEGLPSELLLRRPDLRQAEERLVAENARIGAARAQFFPSIVLTAFLGSESAALSGLFSGPAGVFQFAASVAQPIFNAGRLGYAVEAAEARREQALALYRQAVAGAFRDMRDALAAQAAAREALAAETERAQALRVAREQANLRYEGGVASRLEVLDAERQLLQAELAETEAERAQRAAVADLFTALGGGWE
jgi:multidrug efflux system outer membrane protein